MMSKIMCDNCKTVIDYEIKYELGMDVISTSVPFKLDADIFNSGEYDEVECPECKRI